ncbi:hypothetical protein [Streptacidiphilus fuscans]|uniref:Uncharacterized protein n=1 Tax=Streptacidiphilus fuscans TaxID=2789292 RepID=A0A931BCP3_9ACTN|nr:hypothetical protein [Streptacidiphilus fuscans]MBF9072837.1 hypothetical protein [Streptacidiphilus fuscans]
MSTSSSPASAPSNSPSASDPYVLANQAEYRLMSASSVHMQGSVTSSAGISVVNLDVVPDTGCVGSIDIMKLGTIQLIEIGTKIWIKLDKAYWQAKGFHDSSQLQSLTNKYIASDTSNQAAANIAKACDLSNETSDLINPPNLKRQGKSTLDGEPVVAFLSTVSGSTYEVSDTTSLTLVRIQADSSSVRENISFTSYGAAVSLTPPNAADTIDEAVPGL